MKGTYDPIKRTEILKEHAYRGDSRSYYRFRPAKWYGGIVTGDVTCCNLLCTFCWAGDEIRHHPAKVGKFHTPNQAFKRLSRIGDARGYLQMRLSGQEPTIGREHLLKLLKLVDSSKFRFILETNGILIGYEKDYADSLSKFSNLHVRVSLKGASSEEFTALTLADPNYFDIQLKALENLDSAGVSCHPSVMISFSDPDNIQKLKKRLLAIAPHLSSNMEIEELIMYPHVLKRMEKMKLEFKSGHEPDNVPKELI